MGKSLIIAEKLLVATAIANALGADGFRKVDGYYEGNNLIIAAARGHLVELVAPESERRDRWRLDSLPVIPSSFVLGIVCGRSTEFERLRRLMKRPDVEDVVNACDAGREGELIFRLIYAKAGCQKRVKRMWIQSMVGTAIRTAYAHLQPSEDFDGLYASARCRAEADWIVGVNGTRATTTVRSRHGMSDLATVGRVQTPTLAMTVVREREIASFVPRPYWEIHGIFRTGSRTYTGRWVRSQEDESTDMHRCFTLEEAQAVINQCAGVAPSAVVDVFKPEQRFPPALFDITTLQRDANKRFKLSAKQTLDIAQSLYEQGATTYPRTDSRALPEDYVATVLTTLQSFAGTRLAEHAARVIANAWVHSHNDVFNDAAITDHFAIVPTGEQPDTTAHDETRIYELICRRFIAVFHPPAKFETTMRETVVAGAIFRSTGRVVVDAGWTMVEDPIEEDPAPSLCILSEDGLAHNDGILIKALKTSAARRYTDATLLSAMEHAGREVEDDRIRSAMRAGIGRPATRAAIIESLLGDRDRTKGAKEPYLRRDGIYLVPTPKAMAVIDLQTLAGAEVFVSPILTGNWEEKLLRMEAGKFSRPRFMDEIVTLTHALMDGFRGVANSITAEAMPSHRCPKCAHTLRLNGRAYECDQCEFRLWQLVARRLLSTQEVETILTGRTTDLLSGFTSRSDRQFSARLRLDPSTWNITFVVEDIPPPSERQYLGAPCPKCAGTVMIGATSFACMACDFKLWAQIAHRPLSVAEAEQLLLLGELPAVHGFMSRAKRKFSAGLQLAPDKMTVTLVFAPR